MSELADKLVLGRAVSRNRIVFGPHETNLGRGRAISDRHVAYYARRAEGGAGVIVVEEASVHPSDWPYERSPLAAECADGWSKVAAVCHDEGALVLAALGHSGGQGSSAYSQSALWGPSPVPDVVTREVPKSMEQEDLEALCAAFAGAARLCVEAGLDGVEVNAGQWSLLRQFASGLTNRRDDNYGADRSALVAEVLSAVRLSVNGAVVGLRMSCDELAPWAGIVPEAAAEMLASLARAPEGAAKRFDYVTVVRGSAYGTGATRPDGQAPPGFNRETTAMVRRALPEEVAVIAQGSIVDPALAREIVASREADGVEMTRAQIAEPALASKVLSARDETVRPCVLCNQLCQVRDVRNPIVSCIAEPRSGHETEDEEPRRAGGADQRGPHLLVVGGGPAGLECARVAALAGCRVTLLERRAALGGMAAEAAARMPGHERLALLTAWLEAECRSHGVEVSTGTEATIELLDAHAGPVVLCTGSRPGRRSYEVVAPGTAVTAADVLAAERLPGDPAPGPVVVWDPVGSATGVGVAELLARLGAAVWLVTPDFVAGDQLGRTGDLAPSNVRLARLGVEVVKRSLLRSVEATGVTVEDRFSGERRVIESTLVVDAGHRLGEDSLYRSLTQESPGNSVVLAGDALAPRSVHEAILEGRRAGLAASRETAGAEVLA